MKEREKREREEKTGKIKNVEEERRREVDQSRTRTTH